MVGGLADGGADDVLHLRGDHVGTVGIPGDRDGDAGALTVEAEILRRREGDHRLGHRRDDLAHPVGIGLEAVTEAEIGEIDQREGAGALQARDHLVPLRIGEAGAGRVVATAMQQDDIVGGEGIECRQHGREIDDAGLVIEIRVVDRGQAGEFGHRPVVRPARVGNEDPALGTSATEHVHQDRQRAGAAGAVDAADALVIDHATERQVDDGGGEFLVSDHALVGLGLGAIEDALLGLLHRTHDGRDALGIFVDADAEVDLSVTGIGGILGHQHENLVERGLLQGLKHQVCPGKTRAGVL